MTLLRSIPWTIASMLVSAMVAAVTAAVLLLVFRMLNRSDWGRAITVISTPILSGVALLAAPALALLAGFALIRFDTLLASDLFEPSGTMNANLIKMAVAGIAAAPLPAMLATNAAIPDRGQGAALDAARRSAGFWLAGLLVAEAVISSPGLGSLLPELVTESPLAAVVLGIILMGITALVAPVKTVSPRHKQPLSQAVRILLIGLAVTAGVGLLALMLAGPLSGTSLRPAADPLLINQPPETIGRLGTDSAGRDVFSVLGMAARNSFLQAGGAALLALALGILWHRIESPLARLDRNTRVKAVFNPALWLLILYPILPNPISRVALTAILLVLYLPAGWYRPASLVSLIAAAFMALLLTDVLVGSPTLGGLIGQVRELAAGVNVVRGAGYYGLALWYGIATLGAGCVLGMLTGAVVWFVGSRADDAHTLTRSDG